MKKKLWICVGVFLVVMAIAAYVLFFRHNHSLQSSIEKYGSQLTQTAVTVGAIDMSFGRTQGKIYNFSLSNPKYFWSPKAVKVDVIDFQVDTNTIDGVQPIVVDSVTIHNPAVTYGLATDGTSNLDMIAENIRSGITQSDDQKDKMLTGRKMIIKNLYIRDGQITIAHPLLRLHHVESPLPMIHLTNIAGTDGLGASPQDIANSILTALSKQANEITASILAQKLPNTQLFNNGILERPSNPLKDVTKGYMAR